MQPDGRLVAVGELLDGTSHWYLGAFRYLPNGELDTSFGQGGWVDTNFGDFEFPHAVAVQPDGGIVVAGEGDCQYAMCFVLARYRPDGSLDTSFSRDGRATVDFGYGNDVAYAVATQRGGRVVVAGQGTRNRYRTEDDFALARFRGNGRLDRGFSGDGKRTVNFGGRRFDVAYGLAVRGRSILATGSTVVAPERAPAVALVRLGLGGGLARSFGRRRVVPSPGGGIGRAVAVQPDGRILVAGRAYSDSSQDASDWALLRYRRSGLLDRSFGGDGIVVTDFGTGEDSARALAVRDGRILVAGSIYSSQGLARYLP